MVPTGPTAVDWVLVFKWLLLGGGLQAQSSGCNQAWALAVSSYERLGEGAWSP